MKLFSWMLTVIRYCGIPFYPECSIRRIQNVFDTLILQMIIILVQKMYFSYGLVYVYRSISLYLLIKIPDLWNLSFILSVVNGFSKRVMFFELLGYAVQNKGLVITVMKFRSKPLCHRQYRQRKRSVIFYWCEIEISLICAEAKALEWKVDGPDRWGGSSAGCGDCGSCGIDGRSGHGVKWSGWSVAMAASSCNDLGMVIPGPRHM